MTISFETHSQLDTDSIKKIASLAQLQLSQQEMELMVPQLQAIIGMIDRMQSVNTADIPPLYQPFAEALPLREDRVSEQCDRPVLQQSAPEVDDGFYWVPKVID